MSKIEHYDVIVVGGGASGMMAAGTAALRGKKVLILEKNKVLGQKLAITGGGRCNITNAEYDARLLLKNYGEAEPFLYSSFSQFGVKETFSFFENRGLPLVVQARKRAFPHTERASDVKNIMVAYCTHPNIVIKTNTSVEKIIKKNGVVSGVVAKNVTYTATSVVLATGGMSHPETGSTGDGFKWLEDLGHTIHKPTPSIVPLAVKDAWVKGLAGVSLSFMKISFFVDGKRAFSKIGKILFTHFGLSGPLILNSAKKVSDLLHTGEVTATIDMYPDTEFDVLEKKVLSVFENNKNKTFKNIVKEFVPDGMVDAVLSLLPETFADKKVHSVLKEDRKKIIHLLKGMPTIIIGLMGYDRAVVADGGVLLTEIDTKTMESKKIKNLYITGDLLHINRPSGGFSLQLCWTTGYVVGENV
ncbi:MAG: NAD(P)/FAD-dependent oxidoreductase [Minisyncoccia bacterium]